MFLEYSSRIKNIKRLWDEFNNGFLLPVASLGPKSFNSVIQQFESGQGICRYKRVCVYMNRGLGHVRNITVAITLLRLISILQPNPHMAYLANEKT